MTGVIKNLIVYPENMQANMDETKGLYYSQKILLELTQRGVSRENGYRLVQKNALEAWDEKVDFKNLVLADPEITSVISKKEIEEFCSPEFFTKHVDEIFTRVFKE
jgi:adenylosuccinate lyase